MPSLKDTDDQDILAKVEGYAGVITLNRPKALNALSLPMIREMTRCLMEWKDDPEVRTIIIQSGNDKAFCAGGDIRSVYEARQRGDQDYMAAIFQEEYLLNFMIHMCPKPYIALIDGIAMGGGLGISIHGSHRIVTERTVMAMPETNIGFFPDVGASYFLNRCPGEIGTFLGVMGESIGAEDALYAGLATHRLGSLELPGIYQALTNAQGSAEVDDILQDAAGGQSDCLLQTHRNLIDRCFAYNTVEEIFEALQQEGTPIVRDWLKETLKKSPTSLKLALALLRRSKSMSLKEVLALDFQVSRHCVEGHDFFEGIRALLIDKDQNPAWSPSRLSEVSKEMIESYFIPKA
ncbi:MAG: enoyl-CoA hydratase/isomerase family protein [Alphaproteobacteria bacterium]|nr:enoyl-CoA hydratase/isomerase family protein [Alphaproteobacteria bacterium]